VAAILLSILLEFPIYVAEIFYLCCLKLEAMEGEVKSGGNMCGSICTNCLLLLMPYMY
jgi:hypothetical protein